MVNVLLVGSNLPQELLKLLLQYLLQKNKKLSYRRWTARHTTSVEISPHLLHNLWSGLQFVRSFICYCEQRPSLLWTRGQHATVGQ